MNINGGNVYAGIYEARGAGNVYQVKLTKEEMEAGRLNRDSIEEVKMMTLDGGRGFRISNTVELDVMRNTELNRELQQKHPDEPFWGNTGNQWLTFSEFLYDNRVYDSLSTEEAGELDEALQKMTCGMDDVSRWQLVSGKIEHDAPARYLSGIGFTESEDALRLELESSAEALKYFGEKHIADEGLREKFNGLVDMFYAHNSKILDGYSSAAENRAKAQAGDGTSKGMQEILIKLGVREAYPAKIEHSGEEQEEHRTEVRGFFANLREDTSGWKDIWTRLENTFLDYTMGRNHSQSAKDAVLLASQASFARMKAVWAGLLGVMDTEEHLNMIV